MRNRLVLVSALLGVIVAAGLFYYYERPGTGPEAGGMLGAIRSRLSGAAPAPTQPARPPTVPEVGIITVQPAEVPLPGSFSGRVAAFRDVEIRAQVSGILRERNFAEGERVERGQILYWIDPNPFQAALDRVRAQLAQAQATLRQAEDNYRRVEELVRRQVGTEKQLEDARAARDQAAAGVQLAQAEVRTAELNLGYTTITAPVSGVTSLQSPPVGTLILAQQTLLTTITQLDPAYVNFSITDAEIQAFRALNEARARPITERDLTVELHHGGGGVYRHTGTINVRASLIDPRTGTIQVRSVFPNPEGELLPGEFVRVIVRGITLPNAIVVPRRAVSQGPQGPFVYVVATNDIAEARPVELAQEVEQGWVVQSGLTAGERVVVDGVIRVRPGAQIKPAPVAPPAAAATGASAAAGPSAATAPQPAAGPAPPAAAAGSAGRPAQGGTTP